MLHCGEATPQFPDMTGDARPVRYDKVSPAFDAIPAHGDVLPVAPGVLWLRMPLNLTGLSHINLWLIEDDGGYAAVDTGMNTEVIRLCWDKVLTHALGGKPITRVICTHYHPDHMGLAGWLCERFGAPLYMTRREWLQGRVFWLDAQAQPPEFVVEYYRLLGFTEEALREVRSRGYSHFRDSVWKPPGQLARIRDGDVLTIGGRGFRVVVGYGHAPEHACLFSAELNLMFSGDQILPRITPHIGVYAPEPEANPLQEYLDSLDTFRPLPADLLVLPAHNEPFRGLHARLDDLRQHHAHRLNLLEEMTAEPKRVASTLKALYGRQLRPHETYLGFAESLAHLNCLRAQGRVTRELADDGVWRFRRTGAAANAA